MGTWIQSFKGRNRSLSMDQNFLWNSENIYIMDNHRAALWCWLQHLKPNSKLGLFHIDAHYDAAATIKDEEAAGLPDLSKVEFKDYLDIKNISEGGEEYPLIRWDNYLYLYQYLYRKQIGNYFVATHEIGDQPLQTIHWEEIHMSNLPSMFEEFLPIYGDDGWIVNLDLDYLFGKVSGQYSLLHSEAYISSIFNTLKSALDSKLVACLTVSLSPECCGGWAPAENICKRMCEVLDLDFELPGNAEPNT